MGGDTVLLVFSIPFSGQKMPQGGTSLIPQIAITCGFCTSHSWTRVHV